MWPRVAIGGGIALAGSSAAVASKFSSSCRATEVPEFDGEVRETTVYLFTIPLDEALGGALKNTEEKHFHHWALVFHFEGDGSVRTLEGGRRHCSDKSVVVTIMLSCRHRVQQGHKITWNLTTTVIDAGTDTDIIANECDGNLTPFYSKERPMKDGKYYLLGKILTSPKKLRTLAMNHEDNGKPYIATFNNCQEWVKGIANKLGRTIANKIKEHKSLLEVKPTFASQRQIRSPLFFMEVVTLAFMSQPVARTLDTCVVLPASSWVKMSMSTDKVVGTTLSFLH
uniref:Uncharacterized protein n=1 Tax=Timema monikensis TaxID=170555 RepID=A0A7R9HJR9_9NEOP|nr:unnamed protein product [Timema monikensis]